MAQFSVKKNNIDSVIDAERKLANELSSLESEIRGISGSLSFQVAAKANIRNRLNNAASGVSAHRSAMNNMRVALQNTTNTYERTENTILGNLNVGNAKAQSASGTNYVGSGYEEEQDASEKKELLDWLWKGVGVFGPVGKIASAIGKVVTGDQGSAATWAKGASDFWKAGWKIADAVKTCSKNTDVQWWKAALGLNKNSFLKSISESSLDWQQRALHGWDKGIKGTLREFKKTDGWIKQGVGIAISGVINGFSNYDEYKTGGITAGRAVAETVTETAIDWGKDLLIGAAVTAGFAAAGFAAPVFVVGAATVAISVGADWVCEKVIGKKVTEAVSDFVLDTAESGWNMLKTGAQKAAEKTSAVWSGIKQGWNALSGGGGKWKFA